MNGILQVGHPQPLFQDATSNAISPDGEAGFKSEFAEEFRGMQVDVLLTPFFAAEIHHRLIRQCDFFAKVTEHHHAT